MKLDKAEIIASIDQKLQEDEQSCKNEINALNEAMSNETKSSAGDKFETSREMFNQSLSNLEKQLQQLQINRENLSEMKAVRCSRISSGALVETSDHLFLFGLSLGKLMWNERAIFVLSKEAPLSQAFWGKIEGESVEFRGQHYKINTIH